MIMLFRFSIILLKLSVLAGCTTNQLVPLKEKPDLSILNPEEIEVGEPVKAPKHVYPKEEFDKKQPGWVLIKMDVSETGETSNVEVVDYSPTPGFAMVAKQYFEKSIFSPVQINGRPGKVIGHYVILNFSVKNDE